MIIGRGQTKGKKNRALFALFCLALLLPLLPGTAARAAGGQAIQTGSSVIDAGDRVYFGKYVEGSATYDVPWVVLPGKLSQALIPETESEVLTLLSQYMLKKQPFINNGAGPYYSVGLDGYWDAKSDLMVKMEDIYNGFATGEQALVANTILTKVSICTRDTQQVKELLDQKLFPLSYNEAKDIIARGDPIMKPTYRDGSGVDEWWLRTSTSTAFWEVSTVSTTGNTNGDYTHYRHGVRPALYLKKASDPSILLTSAAMGGKTSGAEGSGALAAVGSNVTGDWKLTLADSSRAAFGITSGSTSWSDTTVTLGYNSAITGANEYISAVIVDNSGKVLYYGRVKSLPNAADATGTVTITLPPDVAPGQSATLKVFNEQFNGDRASLALSDATRAYTDYASGFRTVDAAGAAFATIGNVTESGVTYYISFVGGRPMTLTLHNDTFHALAEGVDVTSWFTNTPRGLTIKTKAAIAQGDTAATFGIWGTPIQALSAPIEVTIPAANLAGNADRTVILNPKAKWRITPAYSAETPTFSPGAGTYPAPQQVTLACATQGAIIYYTTDGSEPTQNSTPYTAPIPVTGVTTFKAKAFEPGMYESDVAEATYSLSAIVDPAAADPNTTVTVVAGKTATMSVNVSFHTGLPTYQWQVDRRDGGGFTELPDATGSSYTTPPATPTNGVFQYRCVVTDHVSSVTSGVFALHVTPYTPVAGLRAIQLATRNLADPSASGSSAVFHHIWYGAQGANALSWRVLDAHAGNATGGTDSLKNSAGSGVPNSDAVFLFADVCRGTDYVHFGLTNNYQGSVAQSRIERAGYSYLNECFSNKQRAAMLKTTKSDAEFTTIQSSSDTRTITFAASQNILKEDTLFLLSAEEVRTPAYFPNDSFNTSADYWFRSPVKENSRRAGQTAGYKHISYGLADSHYSALYPAFNLQKSAILFRSAAVGGKDSTGALHPMGTNEDTDWRLTLLDPVDHGTFAATATQPVPLSIPWTGGNVSAAYSGATTGANEYVSAMLVDAAGEVSHYGRLQNAAAASGTLSIAIPPLAAGSYTLRIFNEQFNGGVNDDTKYTDYASAFQDIPLTVGAPPIPLVITSPTTNQALTVAVGQRATLSVTATGTPPLSYQWYASTDGGQTYLPVGGATNHSYTTAPLALHNSGDRYRCVVADAVDFASSPEFTLTVADQPLQQVVITDPTADKTVPLAVGQTTTLAVTAEGGLPPLHFQWFRSTDGGQSYVPILGANGGSYVIAPVSSQNDGEKYYCLVVDNSEESWAFSPVFTLQVVQQPVGPGGEADVPRTGDRAAPWLWLGLMLLAGGGLGLRSVEA